MHRVTTTLGALICTAFIVHSDASEPALVIKIDASRRLKHPPVIARRRSQRQPRPPCEHCMTRPDQRIVPGMYAQLLDNK
jgi:hypothetical protein